MVGQGVVKGGGVTYEFEFGVAEGYRERATFSLRATTQPHAVSRRGPDGLRGLQRRPDRAARPQLPSAGGHGPLLGTGYWNGHSGYRYEVFAVDQGGYHSNDHLRFTIKAPNGTVVAFVDCHVSRGYIESARLRR